MAEPLKVAGNLAAAVSGHVEEGRVYHCHQQASPRSPERVVEEDRLIDTSRHCAAINRLTCSRSIVYRRRETLIARTPSTKIQLHHQLINLRVQLLDLGIPRGLGRFTGA